MNSSRVGARQLLFSVGSMHQAAFGNGICKGGGRANGSHPSRSMVRGGLCLRTTISVVISGAPHLGQLAFSGEASHGKPLTAIYRNLWVCRSRCGIALFAYGTRNVEHGTTRLQKGLCFLSASRPKPRPPTAYLSEEKMGVRSDVRPAENARLLPVGWHCLHPTTCGKLQRPVTSSGPWPGCIVLKHPPVPRNRRNGGGNAAPSRSSYPPSPPDGSGSAVHPREYSPACPPGSPVQSSPPTPGN
jgi:hypothetical protein